MLSPMVLKVDKEHIDEYTELQVLKSGAGYYIGTMHTDPEHGFIEPGSRDSGYFVTREKAQDALDNKTWHQRMEP